MDKFIKNYYKFIADKKEYSSDIPIIEKDDEREYARVYIFKDGTTWLFNGKVDKLKFPDKNGMLSIEDFTSANNSYQLGDTCYFNIFPNNNLNVDIDSHYEIKKIDENDKEIFEKFLSKCSDADKDQGQVSYDDDLVYGAFFDNELVSVSSLWHWGDNIADIGVLTIKEHRQKGLVKACLQAIADETDRTILWRSDSNNTNSINAATKLGFLRVGSLYVLNRK